jgi:hypothetical protein
MRVNTLLSLCSAAFVMLGCAGPPLGRRETAESVIPGSVLTETGATGYRVILGSQATLAERYAAEEFQRCARLATGVTIEIRTDDDPPTEREILIGPSTRLPLVGLKRDWDVALGREGFILRTSGKRLVIAGGRPRGTLFGVYHFLQTRLGCRWFAADCEVVPQHEGILIEPMDETVVPRLEYRECFYTEAFDGDYAARLFCNSHHAGLEKRHGGKISYFPFVHTFYRLVAPEEYFEEHPEYFAEVDGERKASRAQLCLSNPEVLRIAIERVRSWIEAHPEASIISVSQNDCHGYCTCPECRALDDEEGSPSASIIRFVNRIAEAIEQDHPDVAIDTLAYQYSRRAPKTLTPRHNVIVRLCSIECDFAHPLETGSHPESVSFRQDILDWSRLTDRLYVWDYVTDFRHYLLPFPNLEVLGPNIRFFVENGVRGIFEEGNYAIGGGGELADLRAYLIGRLLWEPEQDTQPLIDEFTEAYYGKAAPYIQAYLTLLQGQVERYPQAHMTIWTNPDHDYYDNDFCREALDLMEAAEAAAESDVIRMRVRKVKLGVLYVLLARTVDGGPIQALGLDRSEVVKEFIAIVEEAGITEVRERRGSMGPFVERLQEELHE